MTSTEMTNMTHILLLNIQVSSQINIQILIPLQNGAGINVFFIFGILQIIYRPSVSVNVYTYIYNIYNLSTNASHRLIFRG